jgi:hypothetical protein
MSVGTLVISLVRVFLDRLASLVDQGLAVNALAADFLGPAIDHRPERLMKGLGFLCAQDDVLVAGAGCDLDAAVVRRPPDIADLAPPLGRRSIEEGLLDVGRQRVPAVLVHRYDEYRGAEADLVGALGLILRLFPDLERRDDLPGDQGAVERPSWPAPEAVRAPAWPRCGRRTRILAARSIESTR